MCSVFGVLDVVVSFVSCNVMLFVSCNVTLFVSCNVMLLGCVLCASSSCLLPISLMGICMVVLCVVD